VIHLDNKILEKLNEFERRGQELLSIYTSKKAALKPTFWGIVAGAYIETKARKRYSSKDVSTGKKILTAYQQEQLDGIEKEGAEAADAWVKSIVGYLKGGSRLTKSITVKGNSSTLTRKFNEALKAVRFETKINRGLAKLHELKDEELVLNSDLRLIVKERKLKAAKSKKYAHLSKEVKSLLKSHPHQQEAMLGAIERLEEGGLDSYKQCLASCRTAIESLVVSLSGNTRWKEGLKILIKSETRRKTIEATFNYLSAYGSHGKENPSFDDTKAGVDQTLSALRQIISSQKK